eukprot:GHRR01002461.1.p1 GENE.GHRR01002461.1~~GHRR01002461.1.p1  ORF type:complete len:664 (+),score=233.63 GHRR01002461.1:802-2793(+)
MAGDISLPGLGLSPVDRAQLLGTVDFIIHCAADIRLEADIQETLLANFEGTRTVLELAASAVHLEALVHVSSAFVNMNQPRSSTVDEQLYPLKYGNQVVDVEELARELLALPKTDANDRTQMFLQRWKFPNTYTLGKHMSEQLVARYQAKFQLPIAIVRPSLVSAIAGEPYPGYVGNWAGPIGAGAAMAIGMFDCLESVASQPLGTWDVVPADLVGSVIIATSAAVSSGVGAAISGSTGSGSVVGTAVDAAVVLGQPHPFSSRLRHATHQQQQSTEVSLLVSPTPAAATIRPMGVHIPDVQAAIRVVPAADQHLASTKCPNNTCKSPTCQGVSDISHKAMSTKSDDTAMLSGRHGSASDLTAMADNNSGNSSDSGSSGNGSPNMRAVAAAAAAADIKLTQQLLATVVKVHACEDVQSADELLMSDDMTNELSDDQAGRLPLLIVHAATSSTYPITLMEGWNLNLDFFYAHPPAFRIAIGTIPKMPATFTPNDGNVMACRRRIGWKVWAIVSILRLMGHEKQAKKLQLGFDTFCVHNNSKTDRDLTFSTQALIALEAALDPSEAAGCLLVWRPMINRSCGPKGSKERSTAAAPGGVLDHSCGALGPVAGDVTWRRYLHTQMAGIYSVMFGTEVEQHKVMAKAAAQVGTEQLVEGCVVHDFKRIK